METGLRSRSETSAWKAGYRAAVMGRSVSEMSMLWNRAEREDWKAGWTAGCEDMARFDMAA